ncbi:MAG: SusD/RagB family nutrient-binding outer membrane lipoprotein [Bacteroidota bacterium]|nr:SusD/RagB family nutrient-binding outer membrane lipoprotein [Bacteroidota bacterium]
MKKLNKLYLIVAFMFVGYSCELTDLDQLDNPNAVTVDNAGLDLYWNVVQTSFAGWWYGNQTPMLHLGRMLASDWGQTYDNAYLPQSFNGSWYGVYSGLVPDIDAMIEKGTAAESWIHVGAGKILKAYAIQMLVDKHGDIPFSEAWQGTANLSPKVDDAASIYAAVDAMYDEAIADLGKTAIGAPAVDIYYGSDKAKWITLANTLKFRLALNKGDAAGVAAALSAGVIDEKAEDWVFQYGSNRQNPDSRHPWYAGAYESSGGPYQSNYFMWELQEEKGFADPRLRYYYKRQDLDMSDEDNFTLDCVVAETRPSWYDNAYTNAYGDQVTWPFCGGSSFTHTDALAAKGYWGRDHLNDDGTPPDGEKRTHRGTYPAAGEYDDGNAATGKDGAVENGDKTVVHTQNGGVDGGGGDGHAPLLMSANVYFMRAEAALDGLSSENAADMLETGLRTSIASVMDYSASWSPVGDVDGDGVGVVPAALAVDRYVTYVMNAYNAAADNEAKMNIIVKEHRLASFSNGIEIYNAMRRTGHPTEMQGPMKTPDAGTFPRLFPYPADFSNLNGNAPVRTNLGEKIFWDRAGALN